MPRFFWQGFFKQADGVGKGQLANELDHDSDNGLVREPGGSEPETHTDHTLLDRERNPRDFGPFNLGPTLEDENGTKIIY